MIAIETRYLGPTNSRGARIKAFTDSGLSLTIPYPYERNQGADAHSVAALALAKREGWWGDLIAGGTKSGYVFVFARSDRYASTTTQEDEKRANERMHERLNAILA